MRICQQCDAAFGQRTDLCDAQCQVVGGESDEFRMKISAGQHLICIGEYQRIVGNRVRFRLQDPANVAQNSKAGSDDLRLTANRVRILDPVAIDMRRTNVTTLE